MISRRSLERLWLEHDRKYGSAQEWKKAMQDAILAWASGQWEWCEHIYWEQRGPNNSSWKMREDTCYNTIRSVRLWTVCPICATPRPKE